MTVIYILSLLFKKNQRSLLNCLFKVFGGKLCVSFFVVDLFRDSKDNLAHKFFAEMEQKDGGTYGALIQGLVKVSWVW